MIVTISDAVGYIDDNPDGAYFHHNNANKISFKCPAASCRYCKLVMICKGATMKHKLNNELVEYLFANKLHPELFL